ncbi:MAG: hypoxanthine phosphoribosyltransferase [Acholeplasmatales bacterium]|jgi:hypoxanthine phosphoribosyltransferase|nr:hypoxanthine phosphoribosyltransferase [Acholeplasmatales bacterium]
MIIDKILLTENEINSICTSLGEKITSDYQGSDLVLVGLLKGCNPFISDLAKKIDLPLEIEYMVASSYKGNTFSSGNVEIRLDLSKSIENRDVLIVEDIVDTGKTLDVVKKILINRNPKSLKIVTLLDKVEGRLIPCECDYVGRKIEKAFVVGYGLDYNDKYRNLPYVAIVKI